MSHASGIGFPPDTSDPDKIDLSHFPGTEKEILMKDKSEWLWEESVCFDMYYWSPLDTHMSSYQGE